MEICKTVRLFFVVIIVLMTASCGSKAPATMAGYWKDDGGNVTEIVSENNQYVAITTYYTVISSSQNSLVSSAYEKSVLTWKYCSPAKSCITMETVSFNGDNLDVTWTNEREESGKMTLTRSEKFVGRGSS